MARRESEVAIVIGCGVVGLTAAIALQERGWQVRITAAQRPEDTTSAVAAAIWYPYKVDPPSRALHWSKVSYTRFAELCEQAGAGVVMKTLVDLRHEEAAEPWWAGAVPDCRRLTGSEAPAHCVEAYSATVPVIEMPVYLPYLLQRFNNHGGKVSYDVATCIAETVNEGGVVINCAGLGALGLTEDAELKPIRGQVVLVENPGIERIWLDQENPQGLTYIVPRSGDCVLGGTAEEDDWTLIPDPKTAEGILKRCTALEPRLADAAILGHKVGLRPGRSSVRLEVDTTITNYLCLHNYGHGGAGVTLSWGCAEEVVKQLEKRLVI